MNTWIFVMNPAWYSPELAFKELPNNQIDWGTMMAVSEGDNVFIYISEPKPSNFCFSCQLIPLGSICRCCHQTISILAKVIKILVAEDELIDDSKYLNPKAPEKIRNPLKFNIPVVRLQLVRFLPTGTGLDLKSFRNICGYRGCFMSDFCLDNTQNQEFKNHLMQKL